MARGTNNTVVEEEIEAAAEYEEDEPGIVFVDFQDGVPEPKQRQYFTLTPGEYYATVASVEPKIGRDSGYPYLEVQFNITGPGNATGRRTSRMSQKPGATFMLVQLLKALGADTSTLKGGMKLDTRSWVDEQVIIRLGWGDNYVSNGETRRSLDVKQIRADDNSLVAPEEATTDIPF